MNSMITLLKISSSLCTGCPTTPVKSGLGLDELASEQDLGEADENENEVV